MTPGMRLPRRSTSATFGRAFWCLSLLGATALGCDNSDLKGAEAEVKPHNIKLDLPAVPAFELPAATSDGSHSVKEMRVKGRKFLDTEVTIKGYVTYAYDCATEIRTAEMSDKDVTKLIEEDPTKCRRPVFYIGDTADTPVERSIWVVEVPRPMREYEKKGLSKEEKAAWPQVPPYKVGDEVVVTGDWRLSSPHGEKNSDGLLIYKTLNNATQSWQGPPASSVDVPAAAPPPPPGQ
jgi:hypothetical protein